MKMNKLIKMFGLVIMTCVLTPVFAQSTPKWEKLIDKDGDVVRIERGIKLEIDMANTTGWKTQKMHVFYREVYESPVKVNEAGQKIDEDRFEVKILCSNVYKIKVLQRNWYLHDNHTNIFNFGEGRNMPDTIIENSAGYNIIRSACPPYDSNSSEDSEQFGKVPFTN